MGPWSDADEITAAFNALGETAWIIGEIAQRGNDEEQVIINN